MGSHGSGAGDPTVDVEPETHRDYEMTVTPSVDTPHETVTVDGHDYLVTASGRVQPGNDVTVAVDAPAPDSEYQILIKERDTEATRRNTYPLFEGDASVTFDTSDDGDGTALEPRSYGVIAKDGTSIKAVHPLVVSGYVVDVHAPETLEAGASIRATLAEVETDLTVPAVERVTAVVWVTDTGDDDRVEMTPVDATTYEASITRAAGDYRLAVVVEGESYTGAVEPVGISDPQPLTVVDGPYDLAADWTVDTADRLQYSRPGHDTDRLYVGGLGRRIAAYDRATTGTQVWTFDRAGSLSDSSPTVAGGTVYVGSGGGVMYALDPDPAASDRVVWQRDFGSAITSTPVVDDGTLYVGTNAGTVYALDATDGTQDWSTAVGGPVYSRLDTSTDRVFCTTAGGDLLALFRTDGTESWRHTTPSRLGAAGPVHENGSVFVAGDGLTARVATDGSEEWRFEGFAGGTGTTPAFDGGSVYVGDAEGIVYAVDLAGGGTVEWSTGLDGAVAASPGVAGDRLVVADRSGTVVLLDRATGNWEGAAELGTTVRSPVVVDGSTAFVGTEAGDVEVFTGIT